MRTFLLLSFVLFLIGCATIVDSISEKGTGQFRVYEKSFDTVWNAVLEVVSASKLQLVSENRENGQILAQEGMSAFSYGENVAIFVEKQGSEEKTRVEVVSKKTMKTNVLAKNWEPYTLKELDAKLR